MFEQLEDAELLKSAVRCADWVLEQIYLKNRFWPPFETSSYKNSFAKLIGGLNFADIVATELEGKENE